MTRPGRKCHFRRCAPCFEVKFPVPRIASGHVAGVKRMTASA
jgi:hypothetical protein